MARIFKGLLRRDVAARLSQPHQITWVAELEAERILQTEIQKVLMAPEQQRVAALVRRPCDGCRFAVQNNQRWWKLQVAAVK